MIQLTRKGVVFSGTTADLRSLRAQFLRDHYFILPKLIEPDLLDMILKRVEAAPFKNLEYNGVVKQSVIDDPMTYNLLLFLVCNPEFQRLVQRITGSRRISDFRGRVYRLNPSTDDRIIWHSDVCDHRLVTLSLNLTTQEYRGGALQIRRRGSDEILHEVRNTGLGDALLMPVTKKLLHRVLPVEGDVPEPPWPGGFAGKRAMRIFTMRCARHPKVFRSNKRSLKRKRFLPLRGVNEPCLLNVWRRASVARCVSDVDFGTFSVAPGRAFVAD